MSFNLVFVVAAGSMRRTDDLRVLLDIMGESWAETAPRHRGIAPRWAPVVSMPPGHQQVATLLEVNAPEIASLSKWICIITPDLALSLVGPDRNLSPVGLSYMDAMLPRLKGRWPYAKIGVWLALLRGSKRIPKMRIEPSDAERLTDLHFEMNVINWIS
jgi:hypothetical protein